MRLIKNFIQKLEILAMKWTFNDKNEARGLGRNDPTPMTASILFGMNSSSSQLLNMLQALRLGRFLIFFPSLTSRLPIKKIYLIAQAFQTPTTYLYPTKNPKPCRHSRAKAMLQKIMLQK
jgi:hypothetical protein